MAHADQHPAPPASQLRLLHAADLHLERVPVGLAEIPDHLRSQLVDCSYLAAERVFDAAIAEDADALLLAGDVVDLSLAGPRAVVFLREQFERLDSHGIPVYWAGGRIDPPHAWPQVSPLPKSVHVFPIDHVEQFELETGGDASVRIAGMSSSGDARPSLARFTPHPEGLLTVGVTYGEFSADDLANQHVPYVALGGCHKSRSLVAEDRSRLIHYSGATQGCSAREAGPHGCTLLSFDASGSIKTQAIATDVFRWHIERIEVDDSTGMDAFERQLLSTADGLQSSAEQAGLLVRFRVVGTGPVVAALRVEATRRALLERLRARHGHQAPCLWATGLEARRKGAIAPALLEEDSILGDVLREIQKLEGESVQSLELASYMAKADRKGDLADRLTTLTPDQKRAILQDATNECIALLSGNADGSTVENYATKAG